MLLGDFLVADNAVSLPDINSSLLNSERAQSMNGPKVNQSSANLPPAVPASDGRHETPSGGIRYEFLTYLKVTCWWIPSCMYPYDCLTTFVQHTKEVFRQAYGGICC